MCVVCIGGCPKEIIDTFLGKESVGWCDIFEWNNCFVQTEVGVIGLCLESVSS